MRRTCSKSKVTFHEQADQHGMAPAWPGRADTSGHLDDPAPLDRLAAIGPRADRFPGSARHRSGSALLHRPGKDGATRSAARRNPPGASGGVLANGQTQNCRTTDDTSATSMFRIRFVVPHSCGLCRNGRTAPQGTKHVRILTRAHMAGVYIDDQWIFSSDMKDLPTKGKLGFFVESGKATISNLHVAEVEPLR